MMLSQTVLEFMKLTDKQTLRKTYHLRYAIAVHMVITYCWHSGECTKLVIDRLQV